MTRTCIVVGAGITGATAAWHLTQLGWDVTVLEAEAQVGGQLRGAFLGNVPYEPHGPHIFHTASEEAYEVVRDHCDLNSYRHRVRTIVGPRQYDLSWPLQYFELMRLDEWPRIRDELAGRPGHPDDTSFESYAISIMGPTLYEWCCYGYTAKQWGMEPKLLSASFAPKRIGLRSDSNVEMFRDPYQGWCEGGWHNLVERLLKGINVDLGRTVRIGNLPDAQAHIITAPLDDFLGEDQLPWRGVMAQFDYRDTDGSILAAPVVNVPGADVPYTRMVETRQMSEASLKSGTIIGYEYPGAPVKHYPIDDAAGENRSRYRELARKLIREVPNAILAGRLATYTYIDIDQAIMQGLNAARKVAGR